MDRKTETPTTTKIKKENPDEDIKEFAETAMNELLGWYGYGVSREESSKVPAASSSCHSRPGSNSSDLDSPKCTDGCEWCGKPLDDSNGLSSTGGTFCSELCFSQSRRANFKRNKTCDWCRHVRHTVSYVDFQDGASQLQFCSDKCLNQYKMHIFCRETRAHLELHPHLPDNLHSNPAGAGLITPDLWFRNCKSPDRSTSSPPISPTTVDNFPHTPPLPLMSVAQPSSLMENLEINKRHRNKLSKRSRKRCPATVTCSSINKSPPILDVPQDLRIRHTPPVEKMENARIHDEQRTANIFDRCFTGPFPGAHSSFANGFPDSHPRMSNQPRLPPAPQLPPLPQLNNFLPPVTVLVPYPIILPLPLPIPLPIPIPIPSRGATKTDEADKVASASDAILAAIKSSQKEYNLSITSENGKEKAASKCENVDQHKEADDNNVEAVNGAVRPFRKRKRAVVEERAKSDGSSKSKKMVLR